MIDMTFIDKLIEHEYTLSRLYSRYAELYPNAYGFFNKLSGQERKHTQFLQVVKAKIGDGKVIFNQTKVRSDAVAISLKYIEALLQKSEEETPRLIRALSVANSIEQALIETSIGSLFISTDPDVRTMIDAIDLETRQHAVLISKALETERNNAEAK